LSDALAYTYSPERTQQAQQLAEFLNVPAISRTLDKLSYGEPLTTGAGGLGGTTRFNNDALESVMAIAPMVGPAAKLAGKGAVATGKFVAPKAGQLAEGYMQRIGAMPGIMPSSTFDNAALTGAKFVYPQDEALRLAQQRASLPPSKGGLGLPAGNTPEQRAAAMGVDTNLFHGTTNPDIKRFDTSLAGKKSSNAFDDNVFATTSPQNAGGYALNWQSYKKDVETSPEFKALSSQENSIARQFADLPAGPSVEKKALTDQLEAVRVGKVNIFNDFMEGKHVSEDATIYPLLAKSQDFLPYDAAGKNWIRANRPAIDAAKEAGYAGTAIKNVKDNAGRWTDLVADSYATTNPDLFRSRFAAFDPWRKTAAIAATMGVAAPDLLAGQSPQQAPKFDNSALMK
jgi:hypothetical protein